MSQLVQTMFQPLFFGGICLASMVFTVCSYRLRPD
jgi:hypothetical protein